MIYLDSAAVVKLVREEQHSGELIQWINSHSDIALVSSALVEVEVPRALRRAAPQALVGVPAAIGRLFRVEIDATVRATAAAYPEPMLRSLDAIHLATAHEIRTDLSAFVCYDKRLQDSAHALGLPVEAPT